MPDRRIRIRFEGDADDLVRELKRVNREVRDTERDTDRASAGFGRLRGALGAVAFSVIARQAADLGREMFNLGASVQETGSQFENVFGPASKSVDEFIASFGKLAGVTRNEGRQLLATTGQIAQGMGFAQQASADFSREIFRVAADLASFKNLPVEDTLRRINSALTGERESLKQLGVVIRETDVQQRALIETGKDHARALTQQERAAATLRLILEKTQFAANDLTETQDSAANTARRLAADLREIKEAAAVAVTEGLAPLVRFMADHTDEIREFGNMIGRVFEEVGRRLGFGDSLLERQGRSIIGNMTDPQMVRAQIATLRQSLREAEAAVESFRLLPEFKAFGSADPSSGTIFDLNKLKSDVTSFQALIGVAEDRLRSLTNVGRQAASVITGTPGTGGGGGAAGGGGVFAGARFTRRVGPGFDPRGAGDGVAQVLAGVGRIEVPDFTPTASTLREAATAGADMADQISRVARSSIEVGQAAGVFSREFANAASSVVTIADGIRSLDFGEGGFGGGLENVLGQLPGALGIVGGAINVIGGLFGGGGPSFGDRLADAFDSLAVQAQLLSLDFDRLGDAAVEFTRQARGGRGNLLEGLQDIVDKLLGSAVTGGTGLLAQVTGALGNVTTPDELKRALEAAGLNILDLADAAQALGLPLDELMKVFVTGKGDMALATAQLQIFLQAIIDVGQQAARVGQQVSGPQGSPTSGTATPPNVNPLPRRGGGIVRGAPAVPAPTVPGTPSVPPVSVPSVPTVAPTTVPFLPNLRITETQAGELISVNRTIEFNTRRAADVLEKWDGRGGLGAVAGQQAADDINVGAPGGF